MGALQRRVGSMPSLRHLCAPALSAHVRFGFPLPFCPSLRYLPESVAARLCSVSLAKLRPDDSLSIFDLNDATLDAARLVKLSTQVCPPHLARCTAREEKHY